MQVATYFLKWLMLTISLKSPITFQIQQFPFPQNSQQVSLDFSIQNQNEIINILKYQYTFNSSGILVSTQTETRQNYQYIFNKDKQIKELYAIDSLSGDTNKITFFYYWKKRLINIYEMNLQNTFNPSKLFQLNYYWGRMREYTLLKLDNTDIRKNNTIIPWNTIKTHVSSKQIFHINKKGQIIKVNDFKKEKLIYSRYYSYTPRGDIKKVLEKNLVSQKNQLFEYNYSNSMYPISLSISNEQTQLHIRFESIGEILKEDLLINEYFDYQNFDEKKYINKVHVNYPE